MKILALIILSISWNIVFSQNHLLDSLHREVNKAASPEERVMAYSQLSFVYLGNIATNTSASPITACAPGTKPSTQHFIPT